MIDAIVFDLDGVLVDSEQLWDDARRETAAEHGGRWAPGATEAMQGMSSTEWSAYMHDALGVSLAPEGIGAAVLGKMLRRYQAGLPLLPGAVEAVRRIGARWPLGLASSSNRPVIDTVIDLAGLGGAFAVTVSSEEVARGKPAPDVYLETARRLGCPPGRCVAVEDSANGVRSALGAGMQVVAVPNPHYPPPPEVLAGAGLVLDGLDRLSAEALRRMDEAGERAEERVDEEEDESFPASDPHADWAGPPS